MNSARRDMTLGMPRGLPSGERPLWSGGPDAGLLARHALHVRKLAIYFAGLLVWRLVVVWRDGGGWSQATNALVTTLVLALAVLLALRLYAWASARSTTYTITNRRVVIRTGIALPIAVNLPFSQIASVDLKRRGAGGDIELTMVDGAKAGYLILWPSVKPLHFSPTKPMLRALAAIETPAEVLADALRSYVADENAAAPVAVASLPLSQASA